MSGGISYGNALDYYVEACDEYDSSKEGGMMLLFVINLNRVTGLRP